MSKFSIEVLNRTVYPYFSHKDPDVVLGAKFGEDVALTRVGGVLLASHVDPIVGAVQNIGWLAVHVACNDIATSGAAPRWIQLLVLVPSEDDEALLAEIMQDIARASDETGVEIIGGHTGYSASLSRPLVAVTALGTVQEGDQVLTQGAQPGDHVIITKGIPLEGTAILANDFSQAALCLGLTQADLAAARALMSKVSVIPEAMIFAKFGATSMHDVTRGGLLETLREMTLVSGVGMQIEDDRIPIPKVAVRFASAFQFDPLKMISSGTLAATVPDAKVAAVAEALGDSGILFADIGMIIEGKGVQVVRDGQFLSFDDVEPEADELARMWVEFMPDKIQASDLEED